MQQLRATLARPDELPAHITGKVHFWGNTAGRRQVNLSRGVADIRPGDDVAFLRWKRIFCRGVVSHVFRSVEVANALWGLSETTQLPYEYIYVLESVRFTDVPSTLISDVLGRPTQVFYGVIRYKGAHAVSLQQVLT